MSDTPETDDQPTINAINDYGYQVPCVDIDFARKLERERNEAREHSENEIGKLIVRLNKSIFRRKEAECERNEARDEINIIRNTLSKNGEAVGNGEHDFSIIEMFENLMQSKDYFVRKSDSLERERDEARELLESEKITRNHIIKRSVEVERERDEAIRQRNETNESSVFSCNFYYEEKLKTERERDEAREALREILKVSEPTPVLTYQKMEDIASKALKDTTK